MRAEDSLLRIRVHPGDPLPSAKPQLVAGTKCRVLAIAFRQFCNHLILTEVISTGRLEYITSAGLEAFNEKVLQWIARRITVEMVLPGRICRP